MRTFTKYAVILAVFAFLSAVVPAAVLRQQDAGTKADTVKDYQIIHGIRSKNNPFSYLPLLNLAAKFFLNLTKTLSFIAFLACVIKFT